MAEEANTATGTAKKAADQKIAGKQTADQTAGKGATETAGAQTPRCRIAKCKRPYRAKGYCNVHYREWRQGKHPKGRYKICTKEACRKPRAKGSLCAEHARPAAAEPAAG